MITNLVFYVAGIASTLGFHYAWTHKLRKLHTTKVAQLEALKAEVVAIENSADRRIVVEILKITNRIKAIL